jgi:hypothetical protein
MSKKVKLAILRARHDPDSANIIDQACIEMLMTSPSRRSVLNYWSDNTDGYLDFVGSQLFGWVDISLSATDVDTNNVIPRETLAAKAIEATKAATGSDLSGFDGFVVLVHPGQAKIRNPMAGQPNQPATLTIPLDAGATGVGQGSSCILPSSSNHTFFCHEVGHVIGFEHSYGVWNDGIDWDRRPPYDQGQVYGDPYDIMSSATFGQRNLDPTLSRYRSNPTFAGPVPAGWPTPPPPALPQIKMGCAPARAHVHQFDPLAIPATAVQHAPVPTVPRSFRLYTASGPHRGSPRLLVIHPANEDAEGRGRCYIEYRDVSGWDAGLDVTGGDLGRRAVVVHTLADTTNDSVRCWYRGRILVPVEQDSDLKVAGTPLIVRVTNAQVDDGYVELDVSTSTARGIEIREWGRDDVIAGISTHDMGTPCGGTITYGTWITQTTRTYRPTTFGYGGEGAPDAKPPRIRWTVGTVPITIYSNPINVPTASGTFTIECFLDEATDELTLISRGGEKYSVEVECEAWEADGVSNRNFVKTKFEPLGYFTGFKPGDLRKLDHCMEKYAISARLSRRDLLIPPGPDPYREAWKDRINFARVEEVARRIAERFPAQALGLSVAAAMRYNHVRGMR